MSTSIRGNRIRRFLLIGLFLAASMAQGASSQTPLDLRILIDISGDVRQSMPAGQHLDAVAMLLDQLPEGSRAGIWTFGKYTNHLVTYGRVDAQWHALADASLPSIRSVASWRDISRVIADATFDRTRPGDGYRRELLLLSGGGVNISDNPALNKEAQQKLLAEQVGPIREAGFTVNTIALNGGQGRAFMGALAKETNGLFFAVTRPDLVHTAVARFADSLNPRNSIPFDGREFAIDNTVERFSALLIGASGSLVLESPSGKLITSGGEIDGVTRHDGDQYVRIDAVAPEMGLWRVQGGTGAGSRIYVQSSQLITLAPLGNRYISGENITLAVGAPSSVEPITDYQAPVEVMLEAVGFNGAETFIQQLPQHAAIPGRYTMEVPGFVQADNYQLNITVRALDYSRVISHTLQVHELLALDVKTRVEAGDSFYTLTAQARDSELDLGQSRLIVGVTDSANTTSLVTLEPDQGSWRLDVPDDGVSSEYRLDLELVGKTISGRTVSYKPRPLIVALPERAAATGPGAQVAEQTGPGLDPVPENVAEDVVQVSDIPERASSAAGDKEWPSLLMVFAAVCLVIGSGLSVFYLWLRRRQPFQIDMASDAAAYRAAHNISIRRIQEPGRPFQEVREAATTSVTGQGAEAVELSSLDFAESEQAVSVPDEHGGVPLLEDVVPEDVFPGAMAAGDDLVGEDILPEDIDPGHQVADEFAPEELVPEDMISRAMELQVVELEQEQLVEPGEGVAEATVSVVEEPEPELTAEEAISESVDAVIEELVAESVDEPVVELVEELVEEPVEDTVEELVEDARQDKAVISITRISVEPEPLVEELLEEPEELPDFETVDAALEEEIAADTALAEETELATEWDNVSLLSDRVAKVEAIDEVAEELAGEDPFADYRAEYEATHGK